MDWVDKTASAPTAGNAAVELTMTQGLVLVIEKATAARVDGVTAVYGGNLEGKRSITPDR